VFVVSEQGREIVFAVAHRIVGEPRWPYRI